MAEYPYYSLPMYFMFSRAFEYFSSCLAKARQPGCVAKVCILHPYLEISWHRVGRNISPLHHLLARLFLQEWRRTTKTSLKRNQKQTKKPNNNKNCKIFKRAANGLQWCYLWTLTSWPHIHGVLPRTNDYLTYFRLSEVKMMLRWIIEVVHIAMKMMMTVSLQPDVLLPDAWEYEARRTSSSNEWFQ